MIFRVGLVVIMGIAGVAIAAGLVGVIIELSKGDPSD
jgi:hypothetical protein